jgi:asparagine synthase (glutamine-hydrolysing)
MCGIVGVSTSMGGDVLSSALNSIAHRGPDDQRLFNGGQISFGFARLAILELEAGGQPHVLIDEELVTMFNGEIYNYQEIRQQLQMEGVLFSGTSEVEVISRAFCQWGESFPNRLRGMFAISIWDKKHQILYLVRDPMGKKPLYWYGNGDLFAFSSEVKAIWNVLPDKTLHIDKKAVASFLISDSVPTPLSIDFRIKKVIAGSLLKWENGKISERIYWPIETSFTSSKFTNIPDIFLEKLNASVDRRLLSDVPVGVFLSSGLDSSVVASTISKRSSKQIQSFTLKFDGSYDESKAAERLARSYGFEHSTVHATDEELAEIWHQAINKIDEPLSDPAILPMMLLSRAAKKSVKVAITGDGGDELFLGYPHLKLHKNKLLVNSILAPVMKKLLNSWPDNGRYFGTGFRLQRLARGLGQMKTPLRDLAWRGSFRWYELDQILDMDKFSDLNIPSLLDQQCRDFENSPIFSDEESRLSWWYLRTYLLDTVLVKVDRASMAFGVECRSPLLDVDLVEFTLAARNQGELKRYPGKKLLNESLRKNGYPYPTKSRKHGMGVPVIRLFNTVLRSEFEKFTDPNLIASQGIFNVESVLNLKSQLFRGRREVRKEAWAIFSFQAWLSNYTQQGQSFQVS